MRQPERCWAGIVGAVAVAIAATLPACGGADCEAFCAKADECLGHFVNVDCDTGQCEEFCEQAADIDAMGTEGWIECAEEASCDDLAAGACGGIGQPAVEWCT